MLHDVGLDKRQASPRVVVKNIYRQVEGRIIRQEDLKLCFFISEIGLTGYFTRLTDVSLGRNCAIQGHISFEKEVYLGSRAGSAQLPRLAGRHKQIATGFQQITPSGDF